jgi:hypothetical protein
LLLLSLPSSTTEQSVSFHCSPFPIFGPSHPRTERDREEEEEEEEEVEEGEKEQEKEEEEDAEEGKEEGGNVEQEGAGRTWRRRTRGRRGLGNLGMRRQF